MEVFVDGLFCTPARLVKKVYDLIIIPVLGIYVIYPKFEKRFSGVPHIDDK